MVHRSPLPGHRIEWKRVEKEFRGPNESYMAQRRLDLAMYTLCLTFTGKMLGCLEWKSNWSELREFEVKVSAKEFYETCNCKLNQRCERSERLLESGVGSTEILSGHFCCFRQDAVDNAY